MTSLEKGPELPTKITEIEPSKSKEETSSVISQKWSAEMLLCGGGILFFFLLYGVIQERIMTRPYEDGGPLFTYSAYLVLSNRIVALSTAAAILLYTGQSLKNVAPWYTYLGISVSNTIATFCQYEALKYVSFPTQTLGKCGKTIPVLILGTLISGKKYGLSDYVICVLITIGCTIFVLGGVSFFILFIRLFRCVNNYKTKGYFISNRS